MIKFTKQQQIKLILDEEFWVPIKEFPEYEISSYAKIKRKERYIIDKRLNKNFFQKIEETEIFPHKINNSLIASFYNGITYINQNIKRLMFTHFITKDVKITPNNYKNMYFKDENFFNLKINNLVWKTDKEILEDKWLNIFLTLKPICIKKQRFLTQKELISNYPEIFMTINMYFGRVTGAASKIGYPLPLDSNWTYDNIIEFVKNNNNKIPTYHQREKIKGFNKNIVKFFGSIEKLGTALNIIPTGYYRTADGLIVNTSYEALFSNFLSLHNIEYSHNKIINKLQNDYRYDFLINDIYVEIFGFGDQYDYKKKTKYKKNFYKNNNLKLMYFDEKDFSSRSIEDIFKKFTNKLIKFGIKSNKFSNDYNYLIKYEYYYESEYLEDIKKYCIEENLFTIMPYPTQLENMPRFSKFMNYIRRNKKSYLDIAKYVGLPIPSNFKVSKKYYDTESNIDEDLDLLIMCLGRFPKLTEMNKSLRKALQVRTIKYWTEKKGFIYNKSTPHNYYENDENIEYELLKIINIKKLDYFPLQKNMPYGLYIEVSKNYKKWYKKLDYTFLFNKKYYKNNDIIEKEILLKINKNKLDYFPSCNILCPSLSNAIKNDINYWRNRLGYTIHYNKRYYKSIPQKRGRANRIYTKKRINI